MKIFDEIITAAEKLENDLYLKEKDDRFFKINRRCKKRLHLTCRQESNCIYSIRCNIGCLNERVVLKELKQIHSCSVQSLSKRSKVDTVLYVTSRNFWKDFPTSQNYLPRGQNVRKSVVAVGPAAVNGDAHSSFDNEGPNNALSSPVVYSSDDTSSRSRKDIDSLQSNDSSSTDDYVYPSSQDYLATQNVRKSVAAVGPAAGDNGWPTRNALSSPAVVYSSDDTFSSRSRKDIALQSNDSSSTDDYFYPTSQDYLATQNVIISVAAVGPTGDGDTAHSSLYNGGPRNAISSPVVYSSDDTTSSRSRKEIASQLNDPSPIDNYVCPTTENVRKSVAAVGPTVVDGDAHSSRDNERPSNGFFTLTSEVSSILNRRISQLMAFLNPNNISEEQKVLVSSSLRNLLRYENGLPFIKELFLSYDAAECDKMLFELQMIRSIRFPKKQMHYPIRSIETPTNVKKRYSDYEFDEQDGDEVTYIDKPNQFF
jgi:hypothetical protein